MTENPDGVYAVMALNPLVHLLTIARNAESLMRLEELALRKVAAERATRQARVGLDRHRARAAGARRSSTSTCAPTSS